MSDHTSDGVIALELQEGTYNGDKFIEFITGTLIPQMSQFDGSSSRSVLVMDNCAIHHVSTALKIMKDAGVLVIFLPPYSPDLNPAEELFSLVKYYLRQHDDILQAVNDPKPIIRAAFDSVTGQDCLGWIHHVNSFIDQNNSQNSMRMPNASMTSDKNQS